MTHMLMFRNVTQKGRAVADHPGSLPLLLCCPSLKDLLRSLQTRLMTVTSSLDFYISSLATYGYVLSSSFFVSTCRVDRLDETVKTISNVHRLPFQQNNQNNSSPSCFKNNKR